MGVNIRGGKRHMKKIVLCLLLLSSLTFNQQVFAESYENWTEVATEMNIYLDKAVKSYFSGDMVQAKEDINTAYFKFYEKLGFEKTVKTHISGRRVKNIEALFHLSKRLSVERGNEEELSDTIKELKINLLEDATKLDNSNGEKTSTQARKNVNNSSVVFISSFGLTLREGLEAILVISAIIAYLVKTNNGELVKKVYVGTGLGVVFSVILAIIFTYTAQILGDVVSGRAQELFEGITMFLAVAVLFYMSNWMLSKSSIENWNKYVSQKAQISVSTGSQGALIFSAFLAVAREGAELILFFQGLQTTVRENRQYIWYGLGLAVLILLFVFVLVTKFSVRLPVKPFFYGTSILMFIMCFSFLGKGVSELQEADVVTQTFVPWMNGFSVDFLGIYDMYESLIPQLILLVITIMMFIKSTKGGGKNERL